MTLPTDDPYMAEFMAQRRIHALDRAIDLADSSRRALPADASQPVRDAAMTYLAHLANELAEAHAAHETAVTAASARWQLDHPEATTP